ncbi:MAG: hypothetical protein AB7K71_05390 [Polyangiaceae bacterium]
MSTSRPTTGGRFVARRSTLENGRLRYELELVTADRDWVGSASMSLEKGDVDLAINCREETAVEPPAWLTSHVVAALRSAWRGVESPSSAKLGDFPRRVTRWRAPLPGQESTPP